MPDSLPVQVQCPCYGQIVDTPLRLLQVNPFASAFRPVLPSKRDSSSLNRNPLSPSQTSSAFQPVGTPPGPMGNSTMQTEPTAGTAQLPAAPQTADSFGGIHLAAAANTSC